MNTFYYIGYTEDDQIRYESASGGIGTTIIKHLLESGAYGTSMTFAFDVRECKYVPQLIYNYDNYNNCGSIYQDTDTIQFIKSNIGKIRNGIILTCMPCQVKPLKNILSRNGIKYFIISLCCSGQTTIQGTWLYYKLMGIDKADVKVIQYRGNGWPSGIQIELKNGKNIKRENYSYPWNLIHKSLLFRPRRCLLCTKKTSPYSDLSLADPWLKEFIAKDSIGSSFVIVNNEKAHALLLKMKEEKLLSLEKSDELTYIKSQLGTIESKAEVANHKFFYRFVAKLSNNGKYMNLVTKYLVILKIHTFLITKLRHMLSIKISLKNKLKSLKNYFFWRRISKKLGGAKSRVYFDSKVNIVNPDAIFFGSNVGVGEGTRFLPIKVSVGKAYTPKIIIGDGCQIGKNNSFACIHNITIGNNVLFAGNVHITDHSHGYEDITLPVFKQPLISKGGISIGEDSWLGFSCEILSGVNIGKHCVVAARAVVTKDVPDYCVVAGNPAKIIKKYNTISKKWERCL